MISDGLVITTCRVADYWSAMDRIVHRYYAQGGDKVVDGMPELDIDWEMFRALEAKHMHHLVATFDRGRMVGFVQNILTWHPHHKTALMAMCDILAVEVSHRGRGLGRD